MVSKSQRKQILQLKQKKYRLSQGFFVAEGEKVVQDLLKAGWKYSCLFTLTPISYPEAVQISLEEMKQITHFKSPSPMLGVFEIPERKLKKPEPISIAVDNVSDPGNLGTIIRLCDWFGVDELICSSDTVDCFNSKVVQATMGSLVRVQCRYEPNLAGYLQSLGKPLIGADSSGASIYETSLPKKACFVFGSESHGISDEVSVLLNAQISIPNFRLNNGAESLNVATATAIFLSEIFRGS